MRRSGSAFVCIGVVMMQLLLVNGLPPVDPEVRAQLEAKVMSSMSLKDLEAMVENDERVVNVPKKFILLPKPRDSFSGYRPEELDQKAYIIEKKTKYPKKAFSDGIGYDNVDARYGSSYEPRFKFESSFKYDEEFPALFGIADMETAGSSPVKSFYESLVQEVMKSEKPQFEKNPFALLEMAASESVPSYNPRFDYDAYVKDPIETKLKGKVYWRDAPERREETVDENGCRTVVKKVMDPEDEKKSNGGKPKSVIITKECEYPNVNGPDAKLREMSSDLDSESSRLDSEPSTHFDSEAPSYESSRPIELDMEAPKARDPLSPDYIDGMLESHFKIFPGFNNPITSFKGYQDRFKLRTPSAFKEIKPTVDVQSYEYSHPSSGFENEDETRSRDLKSVVPEPYKRQYRTESPPKGELRYKNSKDSYGNQKEASPKVFEHHYHYDYPENTPRKAEEYDEDKKDSKSSGKKDPKMMKKSFAYYRKDNPKDDPNDHQYAEEYAQGNYRSFSSDYDSDRDGPKKN